MAVTTQSMEQADVTFVFETLSRVEVRDDDGYGRNAIRQLPWCFLKFEDPTAAEERKYVQPLAPELVTCGINQSELRDMSYGETTPGMSWAFGRAFLEYGPFAPFPYEQFRPSRSNGSGDDENIDGPMAIHFFGYI